MKNKTSINPAFVDYLKEKCNLDQTSVNGLMVGARGATINQFYDKFRHQFDLDSETIGLAIKGYQLM